jgi:pimeloyl-ACP methyl ester carboxylesterase
MDYPHELPDESELSVRRVKAGGLHLALRLWGDRQKPLILLQHGGKDHGRSWDWTVRELMDHYCVAVPDLRGHGDSDRPSGWGYDTIDFISDLAFIVEHLVEDGFKAPFPVVGHSLGGNIALHYAAAQPHRVKAAVSIEGLGFSQKSYDEVVAKPLAARYRDALERRLKVASRAPRNFRSRDEGIKRLAALHKQLHPQQAEHLGRHALREEGEGWTWKHDPLLAFSSIRPVPPSEYGPVYGSIEVPVLLIYGKDSWASSPREDGRANVFQNGRLVEIEKAGHWPHHDQFDVFIETLKPFLSETA